MKKLIPYATILLLAVSCGVPEKPAANQPAEEVTTLELKDILNAEAITSFLKGGKLEVAIAKEQFLKGVNAYENSKQLDSAEYYLEKSLLAQPSENAYFLYGKVLKDKQDFANAKVAFRLAEKLGYEPFSSILYEICGTYALEKEFAQAGNYLTYAIQAGFNNMNKLENDPDFADFRESWYYDDAVKAGLRGISDPKTMMWLQFRKQFPSTAENYQTKIKFSERELEALTYISYDFEMYVSEMRDEKFSRETSKGFYYVGTVYETDTYVALLYIEKDEFGMKWYPVQYRLATFTKEGKLIDKKTIAGGTNETLIVKKATFFPGGNINVETLEAEMEKDIDEFGFAENKILGTKLLSEEKFEISENGKIVSVQVNDLSVN